jgi:hypothetical protein
MGEGVAAPEPRELPATRAGEPRRRRWLAVVAALVVLAAGGAGVALLWRPGGRATAVAIADAAPAIARAPDARPLDAAPPGPDAAALPPPDARPHGKVHRTPRADAGPTAAPGTVQLSSTPWATVRVVGRRESCKETPCTLRLPPGTYRIRFENPLAHLDKETVVSVESGRTITVRESLTRP